MLTRHYGERLYKCRYIYCSFQRHGFNSQTSLNSHEKEHEKPWRCDVKGCDFEQGGFLSRKMRDEHLERFHTPVHTAGSGEVKDLNEDELKQICLDIIQADDVSKIRELVTSGTIQVKDYIFDLVACAAQYASPELMNLLLDLEGQWRPEGVIFHQLFRKLLLPEVVAANNVRMLEYLLYRNDEDWKIQTNTHASYHREDGITEVLANGTDEMVDVLCRWVEQDLLRKHVRSYLVSSNMVAATAGDAYREQVLLRLWKKIPRHWWERNVWKNAMIQVASTTCSIELAKFLVDQGVPVDWRNSHVFPTPLVHAARKDSLEAAKLTKFILFNGGNPVVSMDAGTRTINIAQEKGARNISKWLGVTFDELVAQAREARGETETPDSPAVEKEPDETSADSTSGENLLPFQCLSCHEEVIMDLLEPCPRCGNYYHIET